MIRIKLSYYKNFESHNRYKFCVERMRCQSLIFFYQCPFVRALAFGSLWGFKTDALRAGSLEQLIDLLSIHRRKSLARKKTGLLTLLFYPLCFTVSGKVGMGEFFEGRKTLEQLLFCFNSAVMEFSEVSSLRLAEDFERVLRLFFKGLVSSFTRSFESQCGCCFPRRASWGGDGGSRWSRFTYFSSIHRDPRPIGISCGVTSLGLGISLCREPFLERSGLVFWCKLIVDDINASVDPNGWFSRIPIRSVRKRLNKFN